MHDDDHDSKHASDDDGDDDDDDDDDDDKKMSSSSAPRRATRKARAGLPAHLQIVPPVLKLLALLTNFPNAIETGECGCRGKVEMEVILC